MPNYLSVSAKRKIQWAFICIVIGMCLSACSSFPVKPDREILEARVRGLMDAKTNNAWGEVYEYYEPSYKEGVSRDAFVGKGRKAEIVRYEIDSIDISPSGDTATVKVKNDISAMAYEFPGIIMTQNWVKIGGTWYVQEKTKSKKGLNND